MKNLYKSKSEIWVDNLYPFIFIAIGIFGYLLNTSQIFTAIPGDLGDARFNSVVLEHVFKWVSGSEKSLWSPQYFYPYRWVLAFSDNHFGSALGYIVLRFLGFEREYAFLGWFWIGTLLNFFCTFWALKKLRFSSLSSAAGAFVYAFSLPALSLEMHAQLVYRFSVPLAFASILMYLSERKSKELWWCLIWLSIQFFCSIYLGIFLIYLLVATFFVWLFTRTQFSAKLNHFRVTRSHKVLVVIALLSIGLSLITLGIYGLIARQYGFHREVDEVLSMTPSVASYFLADRSGISSWVGAWVRSIPPHLVHEQQMFLGLGVWLAMLLGLYSCFYKNTHRELGTLAIGALLLLFMLTISFSSISAYRLLLYIPGLSSVRVVSRIILVMLLPVSVLVAIGVDYLCARYRNSYVLIIAVIVFSPELLAYRPYSAPISEWIERRDLARHLYFSNTSSSVDDIVFVTGKNDAQFFLTELDGMILAQDLNLPTLNGYSGNSPPGHITPNPCINLGDRLDQLSKQNGDAGNVFIGKHLTIINLNGPCSLTR